MCEDCGGICAVLDRLILSHLAMTGQPTPEVSAEDYLNAGGTKRKYFHPTEYIGARSGDDTMSFFDFIEEAARIGMTPQQLETEIASRCGFPEAVSSWIREEKIPNGMVRKIILTNAEIVVRKHGAKPQMTLLEAA